MVRPAFAEEALPGLMGEIFAARMSLSLRGWAIFSRVYDACERVIIQRRCAVLLLILAPDAAGQLLFKG